MKHLQSLGDVHACVSKESESKGSDESDPDDFVTPRTLCSEPRTDDAVQVFRWDSIGCLNDSDSSAQQFTSPAFDFDFRNTENQGPRLVLRAKPQKVLSAFAFLTTPNINSSALCWGGRVFSVNS